MSIMIQCQTDFNANDADVKVDLSVGKREDKTNAYTLQPAGTLEMSRDQWAVFPEALGRGVRRPNVVTFV